MEAKKYYHYSLLCFFLLVLFHLPNSWIEGVRSFTTSCASIFFRKKPSVSNEALVVENLLLKNQNKKLRKLLVAEERIDRQLKKLHGLQALNEKEERGFLRRRIDNARKILNMELLSVCSQVIYRSATNWNSTLWIGSGERDNDTLGEQVIAVNSPVLKGPHLIGIIEYVTQSKSRVRLLTDSTLVPSVRAVRGENANREVFNLIDRFQEYLTLQNETQEARAALCQLKGKLDNIREEKFLAKGELFGTSSPIWRRCSHILKGVGFNYDFSDEEGVALELRSGQPLTHLNQQRVFPILKEGDLLVTTGMDGVFPADIPVAIISSVEPLKEGEVTFNITAELCAGNLYDLTEVIILPPLSTMQERGLFSQSQ